MTDQGPDYYAFLLRLWRADGDDVPAWRASLQDSLTGKETGFPDLEAVFAYLRQRTGIVPVEERGNDVR